MSTNRTLAAKFVPPGEGFVMHTPGGDATILKIAAAETNDHFSLNEYVAMPDAGPPMHVHTREDEAFYILEGTVTFICDGKIIEAPKGSFVFAPRGLPHTFKNRTKSPAKFLLIVTPPANFEAFYSRIGGKDEKGQPPAESLIIERIGREAPNFGITILGPNPL
ncbi:MAG: cupin domain-containing protein [Phycisphaerales bacterium]|nr:cupin domain-containing protein [Phycisphaerales bacterium]